jgi:hypothetical protein
MLHAATWLGGGLNPVSAPNQAIALATLISIAGLKAPARVSPANLRLYTEEVVLCDRLQLPRYHH